MGIIATARNDAAAAFAAFKLASTPTRTQKRRYIAALVTWGQEWLARFDEQEAGAPVAFAESKAAQFNAFIHTLPEVAPDPVNPAE